jgi:RHS repeat-associated protein
MTQGNKNVKLVKVTDPRGNATGLAYYTAPQDPTFKWSLETVTDRLTRATGFAYSVPSGGGIQTVVTDPKTNPTTYLMDASGRPVQSANAKSQVTKLGWDSDNNVTSLLTEANGAQTTWTYDPDTGYPLTMKDAQANHDGTAGTTYTYQTSLNGHVADLTGELTPQQRLWTFGYDSSGNVTSVTKPLGNASGAASGSYTTRYTYDSTGDLTASTDPDGNETKYGPSYDPTGYPLTVTDPRGNATAYTYDQTGDVTSVTDPMKNGTSTYAYDVFGRPLQSTVPKTSTVSITTPAPVYDGNDNVTQSTAPDGAVTTYSFDAGDEPSSKVTPADTSGGTAPETTYSYDADGNLHTQTAPKGNVPGAAAGSYTTTYGYDAIGELTSATDAANDKTQYGYDDAGNQASVTDPRNNETQYAYNLNHQVTQVTDAAQHTTKTGYDLDGNVDSTTDANNNTTLYTLDADGQVTQQEVPAQKPGAAASYDVTQYVYDQDGNQTQVISPRGSAAGVTVTSSCVASGTCAYTSQTQYNPDGQVARALAPYLPGDPAYGSPAQTSYAYNADGRLTSVTAPASNGSSSAPNVTSYSYYDTGWVQQSTDPTGIVTSYDYNALGEQASRQITSAGGAMSRTMNWGYYPDGKLQSVSDDGVPTGLYSELVDDTDTGASAAGTWTTATCTAGTGGCEGYQYQTHAAGTGSDKFTWNLDVPAAGSYTVYVKYPVVSGAASNAAYTVKYNGGSSAATATVSQTSDNGGGWVPLGKWAFTQGGSGQQVSLAENSGGTAVAGAVEIVRDNTGETNTATHGDTYAYDPDGNATTVTDSSPGAAVASYVMGYDQLDRTASVTEDNSSGTAVHVTTYGYDPDGNLASQHHDLNLAMPAYDTYGYNDLDQLQTETDKKSTADASPQVTGFTYTPAGQVATETKPNGNTVTSAYYADNLPYTAVEDTSGGTLVSSHTYAYDPDGNKSQDVEKLMSADASGSYLSHTLGYAYDPQDQVTQVTTDGTATESYTHDAEGDVTAQTVNGTSTGYDFVQGRLESATAGGATADYNYDPLGRLDTVTAAGQTLQTDTYDGFDNLTATSQLNASTGSMDTTSYTYDSLNRMASQTSGAGTTSFSYLGTSSEVASESDPGGVSKTYDYTPAGARLSQDTAGGAGPTGYGYYSYNGHSDVEAVTGANGDTTATYGYTAYGDPVTSMFTGADKNDATSSSSSTTQPYSSYRFNAMRWDGTSGSYDMGFRNYDPGLNQFASRDMYDGALSDMGLTADPFTGSLYAFGGGNPVSNTELDGHAFLAPAGGAEGSSTSCLGPEIGAGCGGSTPSYLNAPASSGSGSSGSGSSGSGSTGSSSTPFAGCVAFGKTGSCPANPGNPLDALAGAANWAWNTVAAPFSKLSCSLINSVPTGVSASGFVFGNNASCSPPQLPVGNPNSGTYKVGAIGGAVGSLFLGGEGEAADVDAADAASGGGGLSGIFRSIFDGCLTGQSFTAGTRVLLADGKTKPISRLKPGDKVLATNTKTGKTSAETVTAVEVNHDHDLYDLRVKTPHGTAVIHTTSSHLFWDPYHHYWVAANKLSKNERLKTTNGTTATADGGTTPKVRDGWMWDLTVPGNNDHDFYVIAGSTPTLVHNNSCTIGSVPGPNGETLPLPAGATGVPVDTGKGFTYDIPAGTAGLDPRVTQVRIMDPVTTGKYQYPNGYVVYMNRAGQSVNPLTGQTIAKSSPYNHLPLPLP